MTSTSPSLAYPSWVELLDDKATRRPEQLLFTFLDDQGAEEGRMTNADLARRARQIAAALQQVMRPGERAVLLYPPGLEYIAGFLGCLHAGVVAVPAFPPDLMRLGRTLPRLQSIIKDSQARVVLTVSFIAGMADSFAEHAPELSQLRWVATDELPRDEGSEWKRPVLGPDSLAFLQYTSGSTGTPRGVMVSHGNLMHNLRQATQNFGVGPETIGAFWLPPYHDMGLIGAILTSVHTGYQTVLMSPLTFLKQPRRWLEAVTRYRATLMGAPNFAYDLCVRKVPPTEREGLDLSCLEQAFCGAEPIRPETVERFVTAYAPHGLRRSAFYPCYGLAEATLMVSSGSRLSEPVIKAWDTKALEQGRYEPVSSPGAEPRALVGCGKGPEDQELLVVSPETLTRCPPGVVGEFWVRGPHVAQGYWSRPEETEHTFRARLADDSAAGPFLRTGDLGFIHEGQLYVVARLKDLIIIRGRNHSPQDIEANIDRAHPALRAGCAAAFSVEEAGEERLVIVQEAQAVPEAELEQAVAAIRDTVASRHDLQVHAVMLIAPGSTFKTSSGKIQRRACKAAFLEGTLNLVHQWRAQYATQEQPRAVPAASAEPELSTERGQEDSGQRRLRDWLVQAVAEATGMPASGIDVSQPFSAYGVDSAAGVRLAGDLERLLDRKLPATLVWEHPTIEALARHLARGEPGAGPALPTATAGEEEPIAIIGMGCRFPQATGPESYWKLLVEGRDAIVEVPPERWDINAYYDADATRPGKMTTRWGGFLENIEGFDRSFFGISPREAAVMDPQQRLLLEVAWEALEDAGIAAPQLAGSHTGVFVGISGNDYGALRRGAEVTDAYMGTGNALSIAANRLSYVLDLRGPSLAVDTACSSSLVATHLACQSLRTGESSLAIAAGVNMILAPEVTVTFSNAGFMAPDGRCKPFDSRANGYVRSEGVGVVVMKPLSRAVADGDRIYAVIRGSAVNQDGRSNGLTAPNRQAQEAVLLEAYKDAGVSPGAVQYVEAHGTGTALGDPIEAAALGTVLAQGRAAGDRCAIGSVKGNIGHLESAAGIAGLLKVALSLHHQQLPPTVHFQQPNPYIPFSELPLRVTQAVETWPASQGAALAGVSAFGFGGTNAHVVLASAPAAAMKHRPEGEDGSPRAKLLPLSARSPAALRALVERTTAQLPTEDAELRNLCAAASVRRAHHPYRMALVARDARGLKEQAQAFLAGEQKPAPLAGSEETSGRSPTAFIFCGQGAQWWGMGRGLLAQEPVFRQVLTECDALVKAEAGWSLLEELLAEEERSRLGQTQFAQPILVALQVALAALWRKRGIHPDFVVGHSVGEIAAAHTAGVLSLPQAMRLAVRRGALMQRTTGQGKMALVTLTPEETRRALAGHEGRLSLAAHNSPASTVISGETAALEQVLATLQQRGVQTRLLPVDYAFHSPGMEPLRAELEQAFGFLKPGLAAYPLISTLSGQQEKGPTLTAAYWARQVREPVLFAAAIERLVEQGCRTFIEVGPHPVLTADISEVLRSQGYTGTVVPSLRRKEDEHGVLLASLGTLYRRGAEIAWKALYPAPTPSVPLPTYPWQHERCWLEAPGAERYEGGHSAFSRLLGRHRATATGETHLWELRLDASGLGSLADHRVQGRWVMPATGYVDLMLAAGAEVLGANAGVGIDQLRLRSPLSLGPDEARTLQVSLTQAADGASLRIHSAPSGGKDAVWTLHATGHLRQDGAAPVSGEGLETVRGRCTLERGSSALYQALASGGLEYGPSFRGLGQVWLGEGEALGRVELPPGPSREAGGHRISPALLDAALQVLGAALQGREASVSGLALPTAMGQVRVWRTPGKTVLSHARLRPATAGMILGDVRLFDEDGTPVAEVRELRLRKLEEGLAASEALADWLYEVQWEPDTREASLSSGVEGWVLLADTRGVGEALAEALKAHGQRKVVLAPAQSSVQPMLTQTLAGAQPGSWRVVDLRALDVEQPGSALGLGGWPVISLAQQLARGPIAGVGQLWLVTRGAQPVGGPVLPAQGALWGVGRTLAWEHPELWGGLVDVDPQAPAQQVAQQLASFLMAPGSEDQVALRGGARHVARLARRRELARPTLTRLHPEATYLITGGLGALGLHVARWMVEAGARRLILMSRTGLPPRSRWTRVEPGTRDAERVSAVRALEALGASVLVAKVDVADESALAACLEALREQWPEVRGVVHAAGVLHDGAMANLTPEAVEAVAAPKALGAWALHRALGEAPLDFFVLFSSAAAVLGSPGQSAYAAANAFLDALAHARRLQGLPALSLSWGPWAGEGMAAGNGQGGHLDKLGLRNLAPERATEALSTLLASGASHLGILSMQWSASRQLLQARSFFSRLAQEAAGPLTQPGAPPLRAALAAAEGAQLSRLLEDFLRAEAAAALGLEPSAVKPTTPLSMLGFDSIMALELRNRIQAQLPVQIPLVTLLRGASVASLLEEVLRLLPAARGAMHEEQDALAPRRAEEGLPLSFSQERVWFLTQLNPDTSAYNLSGALRLEGTLNQEALERTFTELSQRHEVLRATFPEVEGKPVQRILAPAPVPITVVDLTHLAAEPREAEAQRLVVEAPRQPFDLAHGPLLRVSLLRLGPTEHILVVAMHHIISDAWSMMAVLVQEVAALYSAFVTGRPPQLAPLPVQYPDYAAWERRLLQGERLRGRVEFWRQRLAGAPEALELPTDRPRPPVQTYRGARHELALSASVIDRLRALSAQEGATLFMTALAALKVLLSRLSGQQDISVGASVANRDRSELEGLIGLFTNALVLRTDLSEDPTFRQLLGRVRQVTLEAYAHQDVPFGKLVEELQPTRSLSRSPFFQVVLLMQNNPMPLVSLPGLTLRGMEGDSGTGQYELTLELWDRPEGVRGWLVYNTDLFEPTTITHMGDRLSTLLAGISANPDQRLSALPLLAESERQKLLREWNTTRTSFPADSSAHQLFEEQVRLRPDAVAVGSRGREFTYRQLNAMANRAARALVEQGVGMDTVVPLLSERTSELLASMLAISKAGGAYLPLDPLYPAQRLAQVLEQSRATRLVTSRELRPVVERALALLGPEQRFQVLVIEELLGAAQPENDLPPRSAPNSLAYVIFTSGSTGVPKGAMVEHRGMVNHLLAKNRDLGITAKDVIAQTAAQNFDIFVFQNITALVAGARTQIVSGEDALNPVRLLQEVRRHGITVLNIVPTQLRSLVEELTRQPTSRQALASLRWMVPTGESLQPELCREWMQLLPAIPLLNAYGHTECSDDQAHYPVLQVPGGATTPIGKPIQNLRFYVLDAHLRPLPIGVTGEIFIGGVGVGRGYLADPAKTAERFIPDLFSDEPGARLYRTGDLGRWRADGLLEMLGRMDFMVKLRGFRVELGEVETALSQHSQVRDAVAMVRQDTPGVQRLVAYVVARAQPAPTTAELREFLRESLPEHMVPSSIVLLEALPLTANGKVDRKALPAPTPSSTEAEGHVAPRTPTEQLLATIWAQVLGLEQVSANAHFFELGGHSLLATQVMARARDTFHVELALREFFEAPTLSGLARKLDAARGAGAPAHASPLVPVPRDGAMPLSFAQQRLWFLDQLEPKSSFYNIPGAVRLEGQLDVTALERSFQELLFRHEVLRTTFSDEKGSPVQKIWEAPHLSLPVVDLSAMPKAQLPLEVERLASAEARAPFQLTSGPLLRVKLLRLDAQEHVLLLTMHHIISDGWSMGVLISEVAALYEAFAAGKPSPLQPLPLQYVDYASWQRSWLKGEVLEQQLAYWRRQLDGAPQSLELPTDRPRPAVQTYNGANLSLLLPRELTQAVQALARRQGVTPFMVLLAGFQTLLSRYSGQEDLCVGTPVAGRTRTETENLIGLFVNSLVMRLRLDGDPSFADLLLRVRQMALEAYAHQDVPFEKLVEVLQPQRDSSRSPLFQVLCVMQDDLLPELHLPGLTLRTMEVQGHTSKLDMLLTFTTTPEGMLAALEFNTDLYDASTASRMLRHLRVLLEAAVSQPEARLSTLPLLTEPEQHALLVQWNDTHRPFPEELCVHQLMERQAALAPDAVAVVAGESRLTFGELEARANQVAHLLISLGVGPEVPVGLCLDRSVDLVVGLLAILKAGGAYLPLDPSYPEERLAFMLEDTRAPVLLTQQHLASRLPRTQARMMCLDSEAGLYSGLSTAQPAAPVHSGCLAYVIYTSGSTGRPKGVMIEHRGVINYLTWAIAHYAVSEGTGAPVHSSISFDLTVTSLLAPLAAGRRVVLVPQDERVEGLGQALRAHDQFSLVKLTPTHLHVLAQQLTQQEAAGRTRSFVIGGEQLTREQLVFWRRHAPGTRLINEYGPTETVVGCCIHEVSEREPDTGAVPIGHPIANTRLYVLDARLRLVPVGVQGELYIGGDGVGRGYMRRPELTAERFIPDPFSSRPGARLYKTGDRVRRLADGRLEFIGRADFQVKVRGFRIELGEIDTVLASHAGLREVITVAREDEPGDKRLVAYVVPQGAQAPTEAELRSFLGTRLPEHMVPSAFVFLEALPLNTHGKVDRKLLPAPEQKRAVARGVFSGPRDALEAQLVRMWEDLLGVHPIGPRSDFFELGGHSLLAVRLMSRIFRITGRRLPVSVLFPDASLEHLALLLRQEPRPWTPLVELSRSENRRPFFCVHPVGGNVICYTDLSRLLGADQPFYGLQSRGIDGLMEPLGSIEEMAAEYVDALRTVQPAGPYLLGGWSMGGMVAWEMAQQLQKAGEHVELLALIEATAVPEVPEPPAEQRQLALTIHFTRMVANFFQVDLNIPQERLGQMTPEELLETMLEEGRRTQVITPEANTSLLKSLREVFERNLDALWRYLPRPYEGRVALFRGSETRELGGATPADYGWGPLCKGELQVYTLEGANHESIILPPHVETLAEQLKPYLRQSAPAVPSGVKSSL